MTMIVGYHDSDGAVLLADSRATWISPVRRNNLYQDTLQKILPFGPKLLIGFAGDVQTALTVVAAIQERAKRKRELQHIAVLGPRLGRFAKYEFKTLVGAKRTRQGISLILAGIETASAASAKPNEVQLWGYESPHFHPVRVENDFVVKGSALIAIHPFLQTNRAELNAQTGGLKGKADWLISRLDS